MQNKVIKSPYITFITFGERQKSITHSLCELFLKEVSYLEISNKKYIPVNYDSQRWVDWAAKVAQQLPASISEIEAYSLEGEDGQFLQKLQAAIRVYRREFSEKPLNEEETVASFKQVFRYFPKLAELQGVNIFIDYNTGFFGLTYKGDGRAYKGTLTIIIENKNQILFSYAKRKAGLVTISGKARFGKNYDNSSAIEALFNLMDW